MPKGKPKGQVRPEDTGGFGRALRAIRMHRGLSQLQLANLMGIAVHTPISRIERGRDGESASISMLIRASRALGVPVSELLPDAPVQIPVDVDREKIVVLDTREPEQAELAKKVAEKNAPPPEPIRRYRSRA